MTQSALLGVVPTSAGGTVRGNFNTADQALATENSGTSAPSVTYPFLRFRHTSALLVYRRNSGNSAWEIIENYGATTDPGTGDDAGDGYVRGAIWINTSSNQVFVCADPTAGDAVRISRGQIMQTLPDIGVCILIQGGFAVSIHDLIANADKNCESGVKIVNCGDVTIDSFNIANAGKCIALEPGSDGAIASVVASHGFLDTSIHGLFAVTETGGSIVRCAFKQCWFGSHAQYGAYISSEFGGTIDGIDLLLPRVFLNGLDGIHASGAGTRNVNINAAEIAQNGGAGASFSASASSFSVMNSAIGDVCGLTGNTYGVYVGPGCVRYRLIGNDLFGNTSPLLDAGSIGLVKDNLGAPL